ncbi:hypothetical protein H4R33_002393 [Dimargaris cristalligena]|nr:hypothetical protein H4R33_002393 [Dimargaris cristalligena]
MLVLYSWGSPHPDKFLSLDPDCLTILNYLRLSNLEWSVAFCNNPALSPEGHLPFIRDGDVVISGIPSILCYLQKQGADLDRDLNPQEKVESVGFMALCEDTLRNLLHYAWYWEGENFTHAIRPSWASLVPFPTSLIAPTRKRTQALEQLECRWHISEDTNEAPASRRANQPPADPIPEMQALAAETFATFEAQIGTRKYLFGSSYDDQFVVTNLSSLLRRQAPVLQAYMQRVQSELDRSPAIIELDMDPPSLVDLMGGLGRSIVCSIVEWGPVQTLMGRQGEQLADETRTNSEIELSRLNNVYFTVGVLTFFAGFIIRNGFFTRGSAEDDQVVDGNGELEDDEDFEEMLEVEEGELMDGEDF